MCAVVEVDDDIGEAWFGGVLDGVGIDVPPDEIADEAARVDGDGDSSRGGVGRATGNKKATGGSRGIKNGGGVRLAIGIDVRRSEGAENNRDGLASARIERAEIAPSEGARTRRGGGDGGGDILQFRGVISIHKRQRVHGGRAISADRRRGGGGGHAEADAVHPEDAGVATAGLVSSEIGRESLHQSPRPGGILGSDIHHPNGGRSGHGIELRGGQRREKGATDGHVHLII